MQRIVSILSFLLLSVAGLAQTSETRYYKDDFLRKEVPANRAGYSQTVTHHTDGTVTTVGKNLKTQKIMSSETYKGNEPTGIWTDGWYDEPRTLDYNFQLVYSDKICADTIAGIKDYFKNDDKLHYVAPKVEGGDLMQVLVKTATYPSQAKDENISGEVAVSFTVTADGKIENVVVAKGKHILLDKEVVRVFRGIKLLSGPTLNGQPISVCVTRKFGFFIE